MSAAHAAKGERAASEIWLPGHGIRCDGTDETAAWNALFAAHASGLRVHLPASSCVYSSLTWPSNYHVKGVSKAVSVLATNSPTADANILGVSDVFQDLTFTSATPRTGGSLFVMNGNGDKVEDFICNAYFICGFIGAAGQVAHPTIKDGALFSPASGPGSAAFVELNFSNAIIDSVTVAGPKTGRQPDFGLKFVNGDTAYVSNTNITLHGQALSISPTAGLNTYSIQIVNSDFDSAGTISGGDGANSCQIGGAGNVYETTMTNVWCGLARNGRDGMLVRPTGSGVVDGLHIVNPLFDGNSGNGLHVASANVTNWDVTGGSAAGNYLSGVYVSAASTHWSITALKARPIADRKANGAYGLKIGDVAANFFAVIGSDFTGNTAGTIYNGATGTHQIGLRAPDLNFH